MPDMPSTGTLLESDVILYTQIAYINLDIWFGILLKFFFIFCMPEIPKFTWQIPQIPGRSLNSQDLKKSQEMEGLITFVPKCQVIKELIVSVLS